MKTRSLGKLEVSAVGFGCMGFSHGYGPSVERDEAIRLIRHAFDKGCTHFDTAEGYGNGDNERLVGEAIAPLRNNVVLATKLRTAKATSGNDTETQVRDHLAASFERLRTDQIDLYYLHRIDPDVPVEEVAAAMGKLIDEGKIRGWGLSQASADEIRRAHEVTPVSAVQSEYSIMERMFEQNILPLCGEAGIGFVAFSPLASGFLSGKVKGGESYEGDDVRRVITRFAPENIEANQPLLNLIRMFADAKAVTPAQISLAWMLAKWPFVSPIPGSRKIERIDEENLGAADLDLNPHELAAIEKALASVPIHGNRTDEDIAKLRRATTSNIKG